MDPHQAGLDPAPGREKGQEGPGGQEPGEAQGKQESPLPCPDEEKMRQWLHHVLQDEPEAVHPVGGGPLGPREGPRLPCPPSPPQSALPLLSDTFAPSRKDPATLPTPHPPQHLTWSLPWSRPSNCKQVKPNSHLREKPVGLCDLTEGEAVIAVRCRWA